MSVRRRSNWYIYLLAFLIALAFALLVVFAFRSYLFKEPAEEAGLTSAGELSETFTPSQKHNFNIVAMLGEDKQKAPELFVLAIYNAPENTVSFVPLPFGLSVHSEGRNLPNVYAAKGGQGVADAVAGATGLSIDGYAYLDRQGFDDLATSVGNVQYDVPKTIIYTDGKASGTINSGTQLMSADTVYSYIMLAEFEDENERFNAICDILCELINQNYGFADSSLLDTWAKLIMNNADTNISAELYTAKKPALLNTILYGSSPATYYILYGEHDADGGYTISQTSVKTLRQKAGLE